MSSEARLIAHLHVQALDQSFLSSLGVRFLTLLYESMIADDKTIVIYEFDGEGLAGFVSGGVGLRRIYLSLLRRPLALIWSLSGLLVSARKIRGVIEILCFSAVKGWESPALDDIDALPSAELFTIAVADRARGTGLSNHLYQALGVEFKKHGVGSYKILVGDQLPVAHSFYMKMGAVPVSRQQVHGDSSSTVYVQHV